MLFLASWLVFFLFWYFVYRNTIKYGPKLSLAVALVWFCGFIGNTFIGIVGPLYFTSLQALLCVVLICFDSYKSKTQKTPLPEEAKSE